MSWVSLSKLSEDSGHSFRTLSARSKALGLKERKGQRSARLVEFQGLFKLQSPEPDESAPTPSDQRHLAAARKLELETSILNDKHVPLSEVNEIVGGICDIVTLDVEKWDRDPKERTEIVERLKEKLAEWLDGLSTNSSTHQDNSAEHA
jgi:hypothetical protein